MPARNVACRSLVRHPRTPILIVDDVADTRLIYAAYLEYRGFRALTAGNAKKALELAVESRPDVIVMDFAMPGSDGISAARQLSADAATSSIPIIIVTGHVDAVRPDAVQAAGAGPHHKAVPARSTGVRGSPFANRRQALSPRPRHARLILACSQGSEPPDPAVPVQHLVTVAADRVSWADWPVAHRATYRRTVNMLHAAIDAEDDVLTGLD